MVTNGLVSARNLPIITVIYRTDLLATAKQRTISSSTIHSQSVSVTSHYSHIIKRWVCRC